MKSGKTVTTAPGTQAAVTVRKVEGEGAYIDVKPAARQTAARKGPAGRDGRDGASGVTTPANGFVTFSVEPNGDLYVETPGTTPRPRGSWTAMAICTLRRELKSWPKSNWVMSRGPRATRATVAASGA